MTDTALLKAGPSPRLSNMELLRIVAMLFVLVLHADYFALGFPRYAAVKAQPWAAVPGVLAESAAVVAVNVFVLISGWFGLRPSVRGAARLLFQSLFLSALVAAGVAAAAGFAGRELPEWGSLADSFKDFWFLWTYLILYAFAPLLNAFVERSGAKGLRRFLVVFFIMQTFCEYLVSNRYFSNGYSALSFMGLYLLGRHLRLHCPRLRRVGARWFWGAYAAYALLSTALLVGGARLLPEQVWRYVPLDRSVAYTNPLVIFGAAALLLAFSRLRLRSRLVNFLAAGSFSAYLLNTNVLLFPLYAGVVRRLHAALSAPLFALAAGGFILAFFLLATLTDALRRPLWQALERRAAALARRRPA